MNFEIKLSRLEEIVKKMEAGELTLDESLQAFEEGVKLSKECHQQLNQAEEKVKVLLAIDEKGVPVLKDFEVEGDE